MSTITPERVTLFYANLRHVWEEQLRTPTSDTFATLELADAENLWTNKLLESGLTEDQICQMYETFRKVTDIIDRRNGKA